jgi:hypothetical protein
MAKLLFDESPLIVLPSLVIAIGFNEAIILQQLHYLSLRNDEESLVAISLRKLAKHFPFWSHHTIQRTVLSLKDQGLIEEVRKPGGSGAYRIIYSKVDGIPIITEKRAGNRRQIGVTPGKTTDASLDSPPTPTWLQTDANLASVDASPLLEKERDKNKDQEKEGPRTGAVVKEILSVYGQQYSARHGGEIFHCQFAKDTKLIKQLLAIDGVTAEEVMRRAVRYLDDPDPFVARNGYSIGTFFSRWNSYGDSIHNKLQEGNNGRSKTNRSGARGAGGATTRDDLVRTLELSERHEALRREGEGRAQSPDPRGDRPGRE